MKFNEVIQELQKALNRAGESLTVDGDPGPKTKAALEEYYIDVVAAKLPVVIIPDQPDPTEDPPKALDHLKKLAPWVFEAMTMLGWDEVTNDKQLTALCWPATDDCKNLKTVIGKSQAWCSGFWCGVLERFKVKQPRSGAASSWRSYGVKCDFVFGAFIPIRHASGGNHITVFLWWIDEKKRIAACLGGNQGNKVSIAAYNLSGNDNGHDEVMGGPRFPKGMETPSSPYQPAGWKVGTKLGASTT